MKNVIGRMTLVSLFVLMLALSTTTQAQVDPVVDSLFIIASSGEVMHQEARDPAMDSIATYGRSVVPFLIEKLNAISRQEKWTALWILERIGAPSVPFLVDKLKSSDGPHVQRVCWALSRVGDSTAVEGLVEVMSHPRWQVREEALGALGKIKDHRADRAIMAALSDSIGQVRKGAAVAAGSLMPTEAVGPLVDMLGDQFYGARMSAFEALTNYDSSAITTAVPPALTSENGYAVNLACQLLARTHSAQGNQLLFDLTLSPDPSRRAYASLALIEADPEDKLGYRQQILSRETDRFNLVKINSAIRSIDDEREKVQE